MNFIFPGFLFALLAVAIPIIIHLFNLRKFKRVYFSNVQFLKALQQQTSSSQRLKERLILAARLLAIIFLVLAFAKPYIPAKTQPSATFQNHVVSIYVDNSFSMGTVNKEGTLLDEAKRKAKEIVSTYSSADKFQMLTNDFEGKYQRLLSKDAFERALDEVKISSNTRNLNQIVDRQQDVFSSEPNSRKTIYLISDFQKNILGKNQVQADKSIDIRLVRLKANPQPNVSVDSVWFSSPIHKPGHTEKLLVKLRNNSDQKVAHVSIKLKINEQQKALGNLSIGAHGTKIDTLSFGGLAPGWQQGQISIVDYFVTFDDQLYFSFQVQDKLPLLAINGGGPNPYINAVYKSDSFFELENTSSGNVNYARLGAYPMIVLNEVPDILDGLNDQLKNHVQQGGSLLIFPSLDGNLTSLNKLLQNVGADAALQVVNEETKVATINLQHPLFREVFEHIPQKLDLPLAKKYIQFNTQSKTTKQSLLELPGKRGFFNEYKLGKGRVFVSAVPLKDDAGNFARHSVFVPIMYQTALSSMHDQRLFYTLGQDQSLEIPKLSIKQNQTLFLRKGTFEAIPDVRQSDNSSRLFVADQIREAGNYQLIKADSLIAVLAFNYNRSESDLTYVDDSTLEGKFEGQKINLFNVSTGSIQSEIKAANQGLQLWKLCLILALLFLAAEIMLIRFYKISAQSKPPAS